MNNVLTGSNSNCNSKNKNKREKKKKKKMLTKFTHLSYRLPVTTKIKTTRTINSNSSNNTATPTVTATFISTQISCQWNWTGIRTTVTQEPRNTSNSGNNSCSSITNDNSTAIYILHSKVSNFQTYSQNFLSFLAEDEHHYHYNSANRIKVR